RLPQRKIARILPAPGTVSPRATLTLPPGPSRTAVPLTISRRLQPSMVVGRVSGTGAVMRGSGSGFATAAGRGCAGRGCATVAWPFAGGGAGAVAASDDFQRVICVDENRSGLSGDFAVAG